MTGKSRPSRRPKLFLVDDHQMMLAGLQSSLQKHFQIVGTATSGAEVVEACRASRPDAVLLDLSLPDRSGLEVVADLRAALPDVKVIVVTMHADRVMADASLDSGAHGFVPKDAGIPELERALKQVLAGERFVSDLVPKHWAARAPAADAGFALERLTPRQRQILHLIGEGKTTQQIAEELKVTTFAVTFHRTKIRQSLGVDSEFALVRYAVLVRMSQQGAG
ncbi:MAG: response regulator transcription factor [Gemmatimonadales bacterium]|nr:response regulator transcription factor [Gemmatimonadales bacterium]